MSGYLYLMSLKINLRVFFMWGIIPALLFSFMTFHYIFPFLLFYFTNKSELTWVNYLVLNLNKAKNESKTVVITCFMVKRNLKYMQILHNEGMKIFTALRCWTSSQLLLKSQVQ